MSSQFAIDKSVLAQLPESARLLLEQAQQTNSHTVRRFEFTDAVVHAKLGKKGGVVTVQVQDKKGKWLQGLRPGVMLRPATIRALGPNMGSVGEFLNQYLDDLEAEGLVNYDAEE